MTKGLRGRPKNIQRRILGELWATYKESTDPKWSEFFKVYDIGLPLAYLSSEGFAVQTAKGETSIEQVWEDLLYLLDIETESRIESLLELLNASPHERIEGTGPRSILNEISPPLPTINDLRTLEDGLTWEGVVISEGAILNDDLDEIIRIVQVHFAENEDKD